MNLFEKFLPGSEQTPYGISQVNEGIATAEQKLSTGYRDKSLSQLTRERTSGGRSGIVEN